MRMADRHLVDKCLNGDSAAFGMLVDRYKESVYALAYSRLRNFHDAEDITQEAFTRAYQKLRTLRRWDEFHVWIYAITFNLCKNWIKARSRRPDREFVEDYSVSSLNRCSVESRSEDPMLEVLHAALDSLPESYQQVLTLHYLGGMDGTEIAEFLGKSPSAIWQSLSRARASLKKEILDMMSETYEQNRLRAGFTFRVAEMVRRIRIDPVPPRILPWGFSIATGIIIAILGIGQHLDLTNTGSYTSVSSLSGESMVQEAGEFPVDVMKLSDISSMANQNFPGNGLGSVVPNLQNALFMAPQAEGGTWTRKTDMPTARAALSVCTVNGKIYAIGGWDGRNDTYFSTVEEYDPVADRWGRKSDKPTPEASFDSWVIDNCIYTLNTFTGGIEIYEPEIDRWTKRGNTDVVELESHSASLVNGKVYVIGGCKREGAKQIALSTVYEYDPIADKWTTKADMPTPRLLLSTCACNGKIYAIGGWDGIPWNILSDVEEYDPIADKCTKKANMSAIRHSLVSCAVKGRIYAIGGAGVDGPGPSLVEEYDPITDTWAKKADMPTGRWFSAGCVVNGKIYVIGGNNTIQNPAPLSTLEVYDPGTGEGVDLKGKLPATWGEVKTALNK